MLKDRKSRELAHQSRLPVANSLLGIYAMLARAGKSQMIRGTDRRSFVRQGIGGLILSVAGAPNLVFAGRDETIANFPTVLTGFEFSTANIIQNTNFTITPAFVWAAPTIIWGDEIHISGINDTGGHSLLIIARELIFDPAARIVASGQAGKTFFSGNQANNGGSPGAGGSNGGDGGRGHDGGNIFLTASTLAGSILLESRGGDGGNGQRGGDGALGFQPGKANQCHPGGAGGRGGNAGQGGAGGNGGDGGRVEVRYFNQPALPTPTIPAPNVTGGHGGASGANGSPGGGGSGGDGGDGVPRHCQSRGGECNDGCGPGPHGPGGPSGAGASAAPRGGTDGRSGIADIQAYSGPPPVIALPSFSWLGEMLASAEAAYIGNDVSSASKTLDWLASVIDATATAQNLIPSPDQASADERNSVRDRIQVLKTYLRNGLDAFGRSYNVITLLTPDYYNAFITQQLSFCTQVETALTTYRAAAAQQNNDLATANNAITNFNNMRAARLAEAQSLSEKISPLEAEITDLLNQLIGLYAQLDSADRTFKDALANHVGCPFVKIIQFASMVITCAATAGAGVATAEAVIQSIEALPPPTSTWTSTNSIVANLDSTYHTYCKDFEPVGKSIDEFKGSFAKAQNAIQSYTGGSTQTTVPGLSPDYAKLITDKQTFDQQLAPYLTMPEAQRYKQLMDCFIGTAEARNNKIAHHDAMVARIADVYTAIALEEKTAARIVTSSLGKFDFGLDARTRALDATFSRIKLDVARQMCDMERAVSYISAGTDQSTPIDVSTVTSLQTSFVNVLTNYQNVMAAFGSPQTYAQNIRVNLESLTTDADRHALLNGHGIIFSIPNDKNDPFAEWYAVQTIQLQLDGPAFRRLKDFSVYFEHQGRSLVYDANTKPHVFTHVKVPSLYERSGGEPVSPGYLLPTGGSSYVGVSPYGPWVMKILRGNQAVRNAIIHSDLRFQISGHVRPQGPS